MTEKDTFSTKSPEIVKSLEAVAKKHKLPLARIIKTYNDFKYIISEMNSIEGAELEEKALKSIKRYYNTYKK